MDFLVVVGDAVPSPRLVARGHHTYRLSGGPLRPELVATLRAHIPRVVTVVGSGSDGRRTAADLHAAGFPVEYHTDDVGVADDDRLRGVSVLTTNDSDRPMETADSLLDLIGNTPLVRLDRTGRQL